MQDDVRGRRSEVCLWKELGDGVEDVSVGDSDGLVVDSDVDWGAVAGGCWNQSRQGRGDFPGRVLGVFV